MKMVVGKFMVGRKLTQNRKESENNGRKRRFDISNRKFM